MNDLISRQAAIDAFAKFVPYAICDESTESYTNGLTDAYNLICQLPSAQPGWIPCSTALPRDEEEVIVSIHDDSGDYACDYTSFGWYAAAGKFWVVDNEVNMRVTAWMPLPKPWEGR